MTKSAAPLSEAYQETCYWLDGADIPGPFEDRPLPKEADALIVGGGYTGMAAAMELARRGRHAVVLERRSLGWGASSRNGGMVLPDVKAGREGPRGVGPDIIRAIHTATIEAVQELERFIADENIKCSYRRTGHLYLAHCRSQIPGLRALERVYRAELGLEAHLVSGGDLGGEVGSDAYPAGLAVSLSGGLHPARYFAGLARAALAAGAEAHEGTAALGIERSGSDGFRVNTPRGSIRARDVLVATDGYTDGLSPWLRRRVLSVGSYIVATEPLDPDLARSISPRGRMLFDTKNFLFYWRLSPDGTRVLFGGRASLAPTTVARARDHLYRGMVKVHPQLAGVRIARAWGGSVGLTLDRTPRLGRHDGVTYALGYSGTGVAASTWLGRRAGMWMCGEAPPPFAGLPFPPVPLSGLRSVTLPVAGVWYRAQDRCRD